MSWNFGLPDSIYKLTYFHDLLVAQPGQSAQMIGMKSFLYNLAQDEMAIVGNFDNSSDNIQNSLTFLNQIAISERKKEMSVLTNYKNNLKRGLPDIPELTKIVERLDRINLENPENLDVFYKDLTNAINLLRQNTSKYLAQLERVKQKINQDAAKNFQDLTKDDFRFRAYGDIQAVLNSLIGTATKAQQRKNDSFSNKIRDLVLQQITDKNLMSLISSGEDFAAIAAALVIDIEAALQKTLYDENLSDFTELTDEMINKTMEKYNSRGEEDQSRFQRAINGDIDDLNQILTNATEVLNIKTIKNIEQLDKRKKAIRNSRNPETLRKKLLKVTDKTALMEDVSRINFSHKTNTSHGNLYEFIASMFQDNSLKVSGEAATDIITLSFTMKQPDAVEYIRRTGSYIEDAYTSFVNQEKNNYNYDKELNNMNKQIRNAEKELQATLKGLNIPLEDIFIYHDSLKLYGGMETGSADAFHGRSMVIMSAIESLYNAANFGGYVLPNRQAIELIAYNLSSLAAGAQYKGDLEQIFSICAGLLMFDDIQNMALEASQQIDTSSIKNIHMYLLNGYYVPASMILSYTYEALTNAANAIASGRAASAKINTSGADAAINNWLINRPGPVANYWESTAQAAISGTVVQISFLAGFISFINSLTNM